ncbi:chorismate mutase [Actinoplanes sp. LDG1-06]|uniref:Chorismate mutase n=1 Tax=Paractinoplanes ovalisporus TaxID=2810368 RepID=A0ABS2AI45_9ACTN|nr:chorismate mutase [Actinoplanes ovalisporus]MBM2619501.1 chorismate mutase [Actinoplanes ovalisporus]
MDITIDKTAADISALRARIDGIDNSIVALFKERAEVSRHIGSARMAEGGTRIVLAREREVIAHYRESLGEPGVEIALLLLRAGRGRLG